MPVSLLMRPSESGPAVPAIAPEAWKLAMVLGRAVVRGQLDEGGAFAAVALTAAARPFACGPEHVARFCMLAVREAVLSWGAKRRAAMDRVAHVAWPMCKARENGHEILAAAKRANTDLGKPLSSDELIDECRRIAAASMRGKSRGR